MSEICFACESEGNLPLKNIYIIYGIKQEREAGVGKGGSAKTFVCQRDQERDISLQIYANPQIVADRRHL